MTGPGMSCIVTHCYTFAKYTQSDSFMLIFLCSAVVHIEHTQVKNKTTKKKIKHCCTFLSLDWSCCSKLRGFCLGLWWLFRFLINSCAFISVIHIFKSNFGASFEARLYVFGFHSFINTLITLTTCFDFQPAWWDHMHPPSPSVHFCFLIFPRIDCSIFPYFLPLSVSFLPSFLLCCRRGNEVGVSRVLKVKISK